jgi:hypothetical protein
MLKLDHLIALLTVKMLVLWVTVVVFVESPRADFQPAKHSGIDQFVQGPVDGGSADAEMLALYGVDKLVGVEVIVLAEDVSHQLALLFREALRLRPATEVLAEFLFRT